MIIIPHNVFLKMISAMQWTCRGHFAVYTAPPPPPSSQWLAPATLSGCHAVCPQTTGRNECMQAVLALTVHFRRCVFHTPIWLLSLIFPTSL